jgi:hypothetical protein
MSFLYINLFTLAYFIALYNNINISHSEVFIDENADTKLKRMTVKKFKIFNGNP